MAFELALQRPAKVLPFGPLPHICTLPLFAPLATRHIRPSYADSRPSSNCTLSTSRTSCLLPTVSSVRPSVLYPRRPRANTTASRSSNSSSTVLCTSTSIASPTFDPSIYRATLSSGSSATRENSTSWLHPTFTVTSSRTYPSANHYPHASNNPPQRRRGRPRRLPWPRPLRERRRQLRHGRAVSASAWRLFLLALFIWLTLLFPPFPFSPTPPF